MFSLLLGRRKVLQGRITQEFNESHPMNQMAQYHLNSGGKCLRGRLALAEATALQLNEEKAMKWAMACELLHNATLIHDDIQDNDPIRRGQPSLWKKFGVAQAINAGDFLIFRAFKLASQLDSPLLVETLADISEKLVRGQSDEFEQIKFSSENGYWNSYLDMAEKKTGTLFQLPVQGIHILKSNSTRFSQSRAWLDLGICYQIIDDIRDYLGEKQQGQKQKDFEEKKINALVAWLSQKNEHQNLVHDYLSTPISSAKHESVVNEMCSTIKNENTIACLQSFATKKLKLFKTNTELETQNVVLEFIEPVTSQWAVNDE